MVNTSVRRRSRGVTVLETVVGLAVTTIVVTVAMDSGRPSAVAATKSLERLQATRAAASELERLDRSGVTAGRRAFQPGLAGTSGAVDIAELSPTLFEATARVALADGTSVSATTRVVKEAVR